MVRSYEETRRGPTVFPATLGTGESEPSPAPSSNLRGMAANIVAVDLGGTKVAAARFDDEFTLIERTRLPTPRTAPELVPAVIDAARQVWSQDVIAVGIGVAGLVHWPEGRLAWVPHVAGAGVDLRVRVGEALGVPVIVDHDANCGALAEFELGAARTYLSGMLVTVGTGIGGGIVIDGEIYRGRSFAGEIGHMKVDQGGPQCPCGGIGCWEVRASGSALTRQARAEVDRHPDGAVARIAAGRPPVGEDVSAAAEEGDAAAAGILDDVAKWFGRGLANLVASLDPEVIVVGGGLGSSGHRFLGAARAEVEEELYGAPYRPATPILPAAFGADATLVGAALIAWREESLLFRLKERTRRLSDSLRADDAERRPRRARPSRRLGPG